MKQLDRFRFGAILFAMLSPWMMLTPWTSGTFAKEGHDHQTGKIVGDASLGEAADETGFASLFNGQDLSDWSGQPGCWEVHQGAIQSTGKGVSRNWLIRRGIEPTDFELRLQFRFQQGNSGVQVRSTDLGDWQVRGYQVEIAEHDVMGLWHHSLMSPDEATQNTRKHLATAGQRVVIGRDGTKTVAQFADPAVRQAKCRDGQWNDLAVIARGPRLIQKINGVVFADLTDHQSEFASRSGVIAFQDHGKGTIAAFRNIRIRDLTTDSPASESDQPSSSQLPSGSTSTEM